VQPLDSIRRRLTAARPGVTAEPVTYTPIGVVRNGVRLPRTEGWEGVRSEIILREELTPALDDLDGFSHIIVIFHLDRIPEDEERRPKMRLRGGASLPEVGLFATRSPLRPNPIGFAVVPLLGRRKNVIRVRGLDALDGTPVLDLKPYLPSYDSAPDAKLPDWAQGPAS
jgi:tRNA-Thr(GGU) m(6)t(6)A37 methyltransferase TsaA